MSKLLEEILSDENVELALEKVKAKKGKSGIDGITVKEIDAYMRENWTTIRDKIRRRRYTPKPVRRVEIPKDVYKRQMQGHRRRGLLPRGLF